MWNFHYIFLLFLVWENGKYNMYKTKNNNDNNVHEDSFFLTMLFDLNLYAGFKEKVMLENWRRTIRKFWDFSSLLHNQNAFRNYLSILPNGIIKKEVRGNFLLENF